MQQTAPEAGAAAVHYNDGTASDGRPSHRPIRCRPQAPDVPPNSWRLGTIIAELPFLARVSTAPSS